MTDNFDRLLEDLAHSPVPTPSQQAVRDRGRQRQRRKYMAAGLAVVAVLAGSTGAVALRDRLVAGEHRLPPSGGNSTGPTQPPTAPPSTPSAANDLAGFFKEATYADTRLRTAAAAYNADLGPDGMPRNSRDAGITIAIAKPLPAADAIPANLPPALLRATLAVLNDLDVRWRALQIQPDRASTLECLRNGTAAAKRFPKDLAAARTLAAATPPIRPAAANSRPAEEVAVRIADLFLNNGGCGSCGTAPFGGLQPIVWKKTPATSSQPASDGTIRTIPFTATYDGTHSWTVVLNAC